jgi:prepilin-type N-terminal cleavage/methylation domain-containing protein
MSNRTALARGARRGFTLVELMIVIAIIVILIAIIMPATQMVRERARTQNCAHNMAQIGVTYLEFASEDTDSVNLQGPNWFTLFENRMNVDPSIFHCPNHPSEGNVVSYAMNNKADLLLTGPGDKVAFVEYKRTLAFYVGPPADPDAEEDWREIYDDWNELLDARHGGQMNVLLSGGSVQMFDPTDIDPLNCYKYEKYWKPARAQGLSRDCVNEQGADDPDFFEEPEEEEGGSTADGSGPPPDGGGGGGEDDDQEPDRGIDEGLIWLLRHQSGNGGWSLKHHIGGTPPCAGRCPNETTFNSPCPAVATGMALLAFLGTGSGPGSGDYQETVGKGVNFLMRQVQPNGYIGNCQPGHAQGYERAFAVMALVECYRRGTQDGAWGSVDPTQLYDKAFRAVNYIANCEHGNGGFRYHCGSSADTSVTAAMTQSLKSANQAQFPIAGLDGILVRLHDWLDSCGTAAMNGTSANAANNGVNIMSDSQFLNTRFYNLGISYAYVAPNHHKTSHAMWAAGGYMRLYINPELKYHDSMETLATYFSTQMQNGGASSDRYFNFYAHHFMRMMGDETDAGPVWSAWSDAMETYLLNSRETQGHVRGSWYNGGGWNNGMGRLGVTCLSLLNLKSYYENIKLTD